MRSKIQQFVYKKNFIFLAVLVPLILIFLFLGSKIYAWETESPMQYWCNRERIYSYSFSADDWNPPNYYGEGSNPPPLDEANDQVEHFDSCARLWSFWHQNAWASICAIQVCKEVGGVYVCEGGHSIDDLIQDVKDFRNTGVLPTKWINVGCFNIADDGVWEATNCFNAGGFQIGGTCYQPEARRLRDVMMNWVDLTPDACEAIGGFSRVVEGSNACYIPQNSILAIDQKDSSLNCGGVQGEESCVFMQWMNGASGNTVLQKHTFYVATLPNAPSSLSFNFDACSIRGVYMPTLGWDYSHPDGLAQSAYQIRIDINDTFERLGDDSPDFNSTEFWFEVPFFESPPSQLFCLEGNCKVTENETAFTPGTGAWRNWLSGKWGQTVYWTVRVRDIHGFWSNWSEVRQFHLPDWSYPWVYFDWEPFQVPIDSKTNIPAETELKIDPFFDPFSGDMRSHVFSDPNIGPYQSFDNWDDPGDADGWQLEWTFFNEVGDEIAFADIDSGSYDGSIHKRIVKFSETDNYSVKLQITDIDPMTGSAFTDPNTGNPMVCDRTLGAIKIIWQIPKYREVAPR